MILSQRFGPIPVTATLDFAGAGVATFQPNGSNARISNLFVKVDTATLQATCTVYKGQIADGNAISNTNSGSTGSAASGTIDLLDGETLYVVWRGGDPGATATATFSGVTIPFDQVGPGRLTWEDPIAAGDGSLIYPALKSPNYATGSAGWKIDRNGDVEFNDATIRGELVAGNGTVTVNDNGLVAHDDTFGTEYLVNATGGFVARRLADDGSYGKLTVAITGGGGSFHSGQGVNPSPNGGVLDRDGYLFFGWTTAGANDIPRLRLRAPALTGKQLCWIDVQGQSLTSATDDSAIGFNAATVSVNGDFSGTGTGAMANPICKLVQQSSQTGLASGSSTVLTFGSGSEEIKTHASMHNNASNNSRVIPPVPGYYLVIVKPILAFNTTTTALQAFVRKNGSVVEFGGNSKPNGTNNINVGAPPIVTILEANGTTDYFEGGVNITATANQATNIAANSESQFIVQYIRPL